MSDHVIVEQVGSTLKLTLNRPEKKNALTNAMYGTLADALQKADHDDRIRCVVLAGHGDSFTAGNDLADFMSIAQGKGPEVRHVARFLDALAMADKPLVAAVQGLAVGIGTTMLLHCDVVCVTPQTKLTTPFVNLALVPEAASACCCRRASATPAPLAWSRWATPLMVRRQCSGGWRANASSPINWRRAHWQSLVRSLPSRSAPYVRASG